MDNIKDDKGINFEVRTWKNTRGIFGKLDVENNPPSVNLCLGDEAVITCEDGYRVGLKFEAEPITIDCPTCRRGNYCPDDPANKKPNILRRFFTWARTERH